MSLTKIIHKYPRFSKFTFSVGVPALIAFFWLAVTPQAWGSELIPSPSGELTAPLPIVGTSLTAGGAFWLLISFLQKSLEKADDEKQGIIERYEKQLERRDQEIGQWVLKYQDAMNDSVNDARTNPRLPQGYKLTLPDAN